MMTLTWQGNGSEAFFFPALSQLNTCGSKRRGHAVKLNASAGTLPGPESSMASALCVVGVRKEAQ